MIILHLTVKVYKNYLHHKVCHISFVYHENYDTKNFNVLFYTRARPRVANNYSKSESVSTFSRVHRHSSHHIIPFVYRTDTLMVLIILSWKDIKISLFLSFSPRLLIRSHLVTKKMNSAIPYIFWISIICSIPITLLTQQKLTEHWNRVQRYPFCIKWAISVTAINSWR